MILVIWTYVGALWNQSSSQHFAPSVVAVSLFIFLQQDLDPPDRWSQDLCWSRWHCCQYPFNPSPMHHAPRAFPVNFHRLSVSLAFPYKTCPFEDTKPTATVLSLQRNARGNSLYYSLKIRSQIAHSRNWGAGRSILGISRQTPMAHVSRALVALQKIDDYSWLHYTSYNYIIYRFLQLTYMYTHMTHLTWTCGLLMSPIP